MAATGTRVLRLPSGTGHDAMKPHEAMLFMRGDNDGTRHDPLEAIHAADTPPAVGTRLHFLTPLAEEPIP